jgi:hypothetical protein
VFKKKEKNSREVRGGEDLSTEVYAFYTWGAENQANEEIRQIFFPDFLNILL